MTSFSSTKYGIRQLIDIIFMKIIKESFDLITGADYGKAIDRGDRKHLFYFYDEDYLIINLFTFLCVYVTNIKLKN